MRHSGLVSLALLILSLWTDLGQGLPRSQATFARDMRGDVMYNVADTGNIAAECIVTLYFSLTFWLRQEPKERECTCVRPCVTFLKRTLKRSSREF